MTNHHNHSHAHEKQGLLSPFLARKRYKQAARFIRKSDTILDLGCGIGGFRDYLPKDTHYYGVDSESNWGKGSKNLYQSKIGQQLPEELKTKSFTSVSALAIVEHLDNPVDLYEYAHKILEKRGLLIITTPHPIGRKIHDISAKIHLASSHASEEHEDFLDKDDLLRLADKKKFEFVEYKRFLLGLNQIIVFKKK